MEVEGLLPRAYSVLTNRLIKDWVNNIQIYILKAKKKHLEAVKRNIDLECALGFAAYNCKERTERRVLLYALSPIEDKWVYAYVNESKNPPPFRFNGGEVLMCKVFYVKS